MVRAGIELRYVVAGSNPVGSTILHFRTLINQNFNLSKMHQSATGKGRSCLFKVYFKVMLAKNSL